MAVATGRNDCRCSGVAVFDGKTGAPVSFNREAVRIVASLRDPDQSPEQLLEVLSYPESTEGGPWGQPLKKREGAP